MSNEFTGTPYDGEAKSQKKGGTVWDKQIAAMSQKQADALVAQHKEGLSFRGVPVEYDNEMPVDGQPVRDGDRGPDWGGNVREPYSRHSPEGFEEVLKTASEEGVLVADGRSLARKAAELLTAWSDGATLQYRLWVTGGNWADWVAVGSAVPSIFDPTLEWRIKRAPRKVWVAFHEGGSVRDIRSTAPAGDIPGQPLAEDYIEFEEKLS